MSVWWEVGGYPEIKPVEVERFTDDSAWIDGRRRKRLTSWNGVFPTWEEAHAYILADQQAKVDACRRQLERANSRLGNIKGMKSPAGAPR